MVEDAQPTAHKARKTGGKVKKKQKATKKAERHNPKAFTFSGGINSVQNRARRALDIQTKREKAQLLPDKSTSPETTPPVVVVVQGPDGVGKSTLIRSLVKHYSRRNISSIKGPITVTSGKHRRLTFVECPNDVSSMLDYAKVADLVLLMIDGSYGFEMETFEFLNILQVHGFPRILGVLTHLDTFTESKALKSTKKKLKSRFWAELYEGAKLFYLSGLQHTRYNKTEISNLSRFISVQKVPVLSYRSQRPYVLSLRYEDHSPHDRPDEASRKIHFYGYVQGATIRQGVAIHIPGAGDFVAAEVSKYPDPCSLPHRESENLKDSNRALRTLKDTQRLIYAPGCDIGSVQYEADAVYIHLPEHKEGFTKTEYLEKDKDFSSDDDISTSDEIETKYVVKSNPKIRALRYYLTFRKRKILPEAVRLVRELQEASNPITCGVESQKLRLLKTSKHDAQTIDTRKIRRRAPINGDLEAALDIRDSSEMKLSSPKIKNITFKLESNSDDSGSSVKGDACPISRNPTEASSDNDENEDSEDDCNNKDNHGDYEVLNDSSSNTRALLGRRKLLNLDDVRGRFTKARTLEESIYHFDRGPPPVVHASKTKSLFGDVPITQMEVSISELGDSQIGRENDETSCYSDQCFYSLFDASVSTLREAERFWTPIMTKQLKAHKFITGGWENSEAPLSLELKSFVPSRVETEIVREREANQKRILEEKASIEEAQSFIRESESGLLIGTYVRIVVEDMPASWYKSVKATSRVIILGGLLPGEMNKKTFIQCRIKRHRWAPKVLKSNDPVLVSVGWRRLQSLPIYSLEDRNDMRVRMLKYTPEHLHCHATFCSPSTEPGAGILAIRNWYGKITNFRISFTGLVAEVSTNFKIVKKLKLVGEPTKIFKNTAFIRNMFTSDLEVAKCIGAKIQTVSGIRGQIKKAKGQDGTFRATFEDKILGSDIVLCKAWIKVEPTEFYNPMIDVPEWRHLRTMSEIRAAMAIPYAPSHEYGAKPERVTRKFNPLIIPKNLEKDLPFATRPKNLTKKQPLTSIEEISAITLTDYEKRVATLLNRLQFISKSRDREKKTAFTARIDERKKVNAKIQEKRELYTKETRKKRHIKEGLEKEKKQKRQRLKE